MLFFPSDGGANVFVTLKVEQALAALGRCWPQGKIVAGTPGAGLSG